MLSVQNEFRHLKTAFHKAWDSIKSWEMLEPVSLRKPIPHLIVQALAVYGFLRGFQASKPSVACDWISFAVGCLVSFHALLRPGEWGALAARQVAVPDRGIQGLTKHALITVLNGKNRRVFGKIKSPSWIIQLQLDGWVGFQTLCLMLRVLRREGQDNFAVFFMKPQGHWESVSWAFHREASEPGELLTCLPMRFLTLGA